MPKSEMRNMVAAFGTRGVGQFKSKVGGAAAAMRVFSGRAAGATAALSRFGGAAGGAGAALGTLAGAAAIGAAVKSFADLDEALTRSQAIMGELSESTMARMEQQALNVSTSMVQSAEEAADAYFFLSSAGLDAQRSIRALPTVAEFAQAGLFNMSEATELLTDAQSALGLTVENATKNMQNMRRVSDVLVKANTMANATVREFAQALTNRAAPAMRAMNIELEEGIGVLAAFADQGVKGRRAGTMFSRVLRRLRMSAQKNTEAFKQLGVIDTEGNLRNLSTVVQVLEAELEGLSNTTQAARLEQLGFTARMQDAILPLIGMSDEIANYERQARMAQGTTEAIAENQMDTLNKEAGLLGDKIGGLGKAIGSIFEPAVLGGTRALNFFLDTLDPQKIAKATRNQLMFVAGVRNFTRNMEEASDTSQTLNMLVAEAVTPVEDLEIASMELPSIWDVVAEKLGEAADSATKLRNVLSEVQNLRIRFRDEPFLMPGIGPSRLRELALGHTPGRLSQQATRATVGDVGVQGPESGGLPFARTVSRARRPMSRMNQIMMDFSDNVVQWNEGGKDAASIIGNELIPAFSQLATRMGDTASKVLNFATQVASSIAKIISSSAMTFAGPGGLATLGAGVLSGLAGFFQHGGRIGRGKFGVVGEAGPELVSGPAQVTPMSDANLSLQIDVSGMPEPRDPRQAARDREWQEFFAESVDSAKQSGVKF